MNRWSLRLLMMVMLCLSSVGLVYAQESQPTQVTAKAWIGSKDSKQPAVFAPTEQIILYVEVSTNTWYTSGTQIAAVDIADVLVKQRNPFAINSSVRRQGQTWSTQLWEIVLYPQKSGDFTVPSIVVNAQVAGSGGTKQAVTLETKPIPFRVELPSAELDGSRSWFSSTKATVKQQWQQSSEQLKVGDSVTRVLTIEAQDSLSVLLPNLLRDGVSDVWQVYPSPAELTDTQSREGYISKRTDSHTYILQQGGDITWPTYEVWWWNSKDKRIEKVTIEGKTIHVKHTLSSWLRAYQVELLSSLLVIVSVVSFIYGLKRYFRTHSKPAWYQFMRSLLKRHWAESRTLLYRKARMTKQNVALTAVDQQSQWSRYACRVQQENAKRKDFIWLWRKLSARATISFRVPRALKQLDNK